MGGHVEIYPESISCTPMRDSPRAAGRLLPRGLLFRTRIAKSLGRQISLTGGFTGHINRNSMSLLGSGAVGISLSSLYEAYPSASMTQNNFVASAGRTALIAPILPWYRTLSAT
jgi:hypothetical protein